MRGHTGLVTEKIGVVGGGILGLATARQLAATPGAEVTVLEKEPQLGRPPDRPQQRRRARRHLLQPGSLKARLCRAACAAARPTAPSTSSRTRRAASSSSRLDEGELAALDACRARARNGVPGLRRLDGAGAARGRAARRGVAALHSPETAITDFRAVALALADEVGERGGTVRPGVRVQRRQRRAAAASSWPERLRAHGRPRRRLRRPARRPPRPAPARTRTPRIVPFRGEYWALRPSQGTRAGADLPGAGPALPFLGVH